MDGAYLSLHKWEKSRCALVVAHPDDETLWAGGTILLHPQARWTVIALCRKSDQDRAPRFFRALEVLGAAGAMGDLNDGPEQSPLKPRTVQNAVLDLLPPGDFDLVITHGPGGEYTRHLRHEETGRAVMALCESGRLVVEHVWRFAYEDGHGKYLPRPVRDADITVRLPEEIWHKKRSVISELYGFGPDSFEVRAASRTEAFWCFKPSHMSV